MPRPVRSNASEDTCSLQEALDAALFAISQIDIWDFSETLVTARLIVFDAFMKLLPVCPNPQAWLQLQINFSLLFDPFDLAWRLVRLGLGTSVTYVQAKAGQLAPKLIWCIDDVQVTLENRIAAMSLEGIWMTARMSEPYLYSKTFLSGTALRLPDLRKMIDQWVDECLYRESQI